MRLLCQSGVWKLVGGTAGGNYAATTPGVGSWTAPFGVTSATVTLLGGGGSAGVQSNDAGLAGNGGGGAGYSKYKITVSPLTTYSYVVGYGATACGTIGCDGYQGGQTSFGTTGTNAYTAFGGFGGSGGNGNFVGNGGIGYTVNGIAGAVRNGWVGGNGGPCGVSSPTFSCTGATTSTAAQWGAGGAGGPNGIRNGGGGFLTITW